MSATSPFATARLGRTDVHVTRLGLGTAPLGGWPAALSAGEAHDTVASAWALGIRYFDTAPFYGHGLSEQHLASVLAAKDRSGFVLSTKVGRLLVRGDGGSELFKGVPPLVPVLDYSGEGVLRSLRESLDRLELDRVDVVLIHDPDDHHEQAVKESYPALASLREEGRVGAIGVGMNWSEPLARFAREADFDCFLLAGRYTLLEQGALDDLLPAARDRGASVIAGGVLNSGLLADPSPGAMYNYLPAPDDVLARARRLGDICAEHAVPLRAAALQFPLAHPCVASVVVGSRSPQEVGDTVEMLGFPIPGALWGRLVEEGLLREDAPLPEGDRG
ncbi:MAG TPA: aldo/keto reductase [Acidimicrobiales bacterium]|nr:aldo/keto reductase [Acidimicrobiales bacterium]